MSEGDLLAVWLTLKLAACTTAILLLLAPPLAWWLSHSQNRLRPLVEALV
ncbi:MAG: molybdate ABC transporter permease subunit, partial [Aeromonas veronii]